MPLRDQNARPPGSFPGGQPRLVDAGIERQLQLPAGRLVQFDDTLLPAVVDGQAPVDVRGDDQPGAALLTFGRWPDTGRLGPLGECGAGAGAQDRQEKCGGDRHRCSFLANRVADWKPTPRSGTARRLEACVPDPVLLRSYAEGLVATGWELP